MASLLVIEVEGHGMTNKVLSTGLKTELFVDNPHVVNVKVDAYVVEREIC